MALLCPICKRSSPERSARCDCGYDFATHEMGPVGERFRDERLAKRSSADFKLRIGGTLLLSSAGVLVLGLALGAILNNLALCVLAVLGAAASGITGTVSLVIGAQERRRLTGGAARPELPAARIER